MHAFGDGHWAREPSVVFRIETLNIPQTVACQLGVLAVNLSIRLWCVSFSPRRPPHFCHMSLLILTFSTYRSQHLAVAFEKAPNPQYVFFCSGVPPFKMLLWPQRGSIFRCMQHYAHHCYHPNRSKTCRVSITVGSLPFLPARNHRPF